MPLKYFPVYFLAYVLEAFFWRSYVIGKRTGQLNQVNFLMAISVASHCLMSNLQSTWRLRAYDEALRKVQS